MQSALASPMQAPFLSAQSVSPDEPRLADSVNSPVVSMTFWAPTILLPPVL